MSKKKTKGFEIYLSAIITALLGILFVFFPEGLTGIMATVVGIIIALIGVITLIGAIRTEAVGSKLPGIVVAILLTFLGVWILFNPVKFATIVPIAIGVMLVVHGLQSIMTTIDVKTSGVKTWWIMLVGGIISILGGFVCIFCAFGVIKIYGMIMGILMIYDGISSIIITAKGNKYVSDEELKDDEVIDADFKECDETKSDEESDVIKPE